MTDSVINIDNKQLLLSYIFAIIAMILTSVNGINRNKDIVIGTIRMTVQLFIAGYILVYIFDSSSFILTVLMLAVMEFFAIFNIVSSKKDKFNKKLIGSIAISQVVGSIFALAFFLLIVIRPKPIYNPQYLVPLPGNDMIPIFLILLRVGVIAVSKELWIILFIAILGVAPSIR